MRLAVVASSKSRGDANERMHSSTTSGSSASDGDVMAEAGGEAEVVGVAASARWRLLGGDADAIAEWLDAYTTALKRLG